MLRGNILRFDVVTSRTRARLSHDAQITRINETNKLPTLTRKERVGPLRIRTSVFSITSPLARKHRPHMRLLFNFRRRIPAMTRRTTQPHRILPILDLLERLRRPILMHRLNLPMTLHTPLDFHRRSLHECRRRPGHNR